MFREAEEEGGLREDGEESEGRCGVEAVLFYAADFGFWIRVLVRLFVSSLKPLLILRVGGVGIVSVGPFARYHAIKWGYFLVDQRDLDVVEVAQLSGGHHVAHNSRLDLRRW